MGLTFTSAEKLAVIRALAPTRSLREIGAVLGVSCEWVRVLAGCDGIKTRSKSDAARLAAARRKRDGATRKACKPRKRKHSDALRAKVKSLKGIKSASVIAAQFGLASRNVVIGIWNRPVASRGV